MTSSTPAAGHAGAITTKNVHDKATASDNNSKITKCGWSTSRVQDSRGAVRCSWTQLDLMEHDPKPALR